MMNFDFNIDEDTAIVLDLISKYLKKYFDYDNDAAATAINNFYSKMRSMFIEEDERDFIDLNFHHDHAFSVACRIHYQNNGELQQKYSNVVNWLRAVGWFDVPEEAIKDYNKWTDEEGYYS